MAKFITPLRVEKIGPRTWILTDDLVYETDYFHPSNQLVAPRGFQTDFASIPRFFWTIFPPVDNYDAAAVIHDACYAGAICNNNINQRVFISKEWADKLFLEAMLAIGVRNWKARIMYAAVRDYGQPSYHPLAANRFNMAINRRTARI